MRGRGMIGVAVLGLVAVSCRGGTAEVTVVASSTTSQVSSTTTTSPTTSNTVGPVTTVGSVPALSFLLAPGWRELEAGPVTPRFQSVLAWTGSELIVWGGTDQPFDPPRSAGSPIFGNGFAFDPVAKQWREIEASPLCPAANAGWVWTGSELVIFTSGVGGDCHQGGAAYDPSSDSWRTFNSDFFQIVRAGTAVVWTDTEIIAWRAGHAFNPATGEHRTTTPPPAPVSSSRTNAPSAFWTGQEVIVLGDRTVQTYDPTADGWEQLENSPINLSAGGGMWTGSELLATSYEMRAATFDPPSQEWSIQRSLPLRFYECFTNPVRAGELTLVQMCSGFGIWDGSGSWMPIPLADLYANEWGALVASEDTLFQLGDRFLAYELPPVVDGKVAAPGFLPVGVQYLQVPEGYTISEVTSPDPTFDELGEQVAVFLTGPDGSTCSVGGAYLPNESLPVTATDTATPVDLVRVADSVVITATEVPIGGINDYQAHVVIHDPNGSDIVHVACSTSEEARRVAEHVWTPRN